MDDHFDTSGVFEISKFDISKFACTCIFLPEKFEHLGGNTFIHCSQITVVHVYIFVSNSPSVPQECKSKQAHARSNLNMTH